MSFTEDVCELIPRCQNEESVLKAENIALKWTNERLQAIVDNLYRKNPDGSVGTRDDEISAYRLKIASKKGKIRSLKTKNKDLKEKIVFPFI